MFPYFHYRLEEKTYSELYPGTLTDISEIYVHLKWCIDILDFDSNRICNECNEIASHLAGLHNQYANVLRKVDQAPAIRIAFRAEKAMMIDKM